MPEAQDNDRVPFKDRSRRLALFGSLAIAAGGGWLLLGLLHLALLLGIPGWPGGVEFPDDARVHTMGATLYVLLGAAFIVIGTGSVRRRRWAKPFMLLLAWSWLCGGVAAALLLPSLVDLALGMSLAGAPGLDPTAVVLFKGILLAATVFFGVLVPTSLVWVYSDRHLERTCALHDSSPDWTGGRPSAVLGLSVGLVACGAVTGLAALRPAVPLFGWLVTGWPGALMLVAGGALFCGLAWAVYARHPGGWWGTTALLTLAGLSTWWTLLRVEAVAWLRALGYSVDSPSTDGSVVVDLAGWLTLGFTVLTVVYMVGIRRHFGKSTDSRHG